MTCPHCFSALEPGSTVCGQCGVRVVRSVTAVMRTSAVWICTGEAPKFYNSLHDVPEPLRKRLVVCTNSANSGTVLIADRGGREQLIAGAQSAAQPGTAARTGARGQRYARIPGFGRVSVP